MAVDDTQPLISHLIELRKRLLNCIITILVVFLVLVFFANDIYNLVSAPLIKQLPAGASMIATDVASPFSPHQADHDGFGVCFRTDDSLSGLGIYRSCII